MADYLNTEWTGDPVPVPPSDRLNLPGVWVSVRFDHDIADAAGHHSGDSPLIGNGAGRCLSGVLDLKLQNFASGVELQIRGYEVDAVTGVRVETHMAHEFNTSPVPVPVGEEGDPLYPRTTHHRFPVFSKINAGHRFGIELSQWPADLSAPDGVIVEAQLTGTLEPM